MTQLSDKQVLDVLRIFSFNHTEDIWWRENEEDKSILDFYVNCSDFFYWGTADFELITAEKIHLLHEVKRDLDSLGIADHKLEYGLLFASRARCMRPQSAYYKYLDEATWPLFDACGLQRPKDSLNPETAPVPTVQTEKQGVE